jgi:hypothetical protein
MIAICIRPSGRRSISSAMLTGENADIVVAAVYIHVIAKQRDESGNSRVDARQDLCKTEVLFGVATWPFACPSS